MLKISLRGHVPSITTNLFPILKPVVKKSMFKMERTSKKDYLTGPRPKNLGVVSGRLRNSIKSRVKQKRKNIVGTLGTNVYYGRIWETRKGTIKKRPFLAPSIKDNIPGLEEDLIIAIKGDWDK
jgi:hypothetical protein